MTDDGPNKPNGKEDPNLFSLAEARKRQRTTRLDKAKTSGKADGRFGASGRLHGARGPHQKPAAEPTKLKKVLQYVQFILFLAVLSYFMSLCQGPA